MTERFGLLVSSMHAAAVTVTYICMAALALLAARWLIGWLLQPAIVPPTVRAFVCNTYDLFMVAVLLGLFVVVL